MPVKLESDIDAVRTLKEHHPDRLYGAVRHIKNRVIGSRSRKQEYLDVGILPELINVIKLKSSPISVEAAYICNSLAHGGREYVDHLISSGLVETLVEGVYLQDQKLVEACLRTIRTIYQYPNIDSTNLWECEDFIPRVIELMCTSDTAGQCCAMIIGSICKTSDQQAILSTTPILDHIATLLLEDSSQANLAGLFCLSELSYDNHFVSHEVKNNELLTTRLFQLMRRDKYILVQYNAAKCLTNLFRLGTIQDESSKTQILDTIVYLCLYEDIAIKHIGANLLHELIEQNAELQLWASYSQHLMHGLSRFFVASCDPVFSPLLRAAAFKAFAALGETQEDIRRSIIEGENIISHLKFGLQDDSLEVQVAALSCLHSLSRSVKQLRTSLLDAEVWQPLLKLIKTEDKDLVRTSSRTLCNLLLDFSPSKDILLQQEGTVELLSKLVLHSDDEVKLNGVWALMNITYKADSELRAKILAHFGVLQILETVEDDCPKLKIKALGLLRNILCDAEEVDSIMTSHGREVLKTLIPILTEEERWSSEEQEQVLCVFINIAAGHLAKDLLVEREDLLSSLLFFLSHRNSQLQIAATTCLTHLVKSDDSGCLERQCKLRELGHFKQLQAMLSARPEVADRAKIALQYFQ